MHRYSSFHQVSMIVVSPIRTQHGALHSVMMWALEFSVHDTLTWVKHVCCQSTYLHSSTIQEGMLVVSPTCKLVSLDI